MYILNVSVYPHLPANQVFILWIYIALTALWFLSIFTGDYYWSDRIFFYHPGTIWVDSGQPGKLQKEGQCGVRVIHLSWTERSLSGFIVFNMLGPPSHRPPSYLISGTMSPLSHAATSPCDRLLSSRHSGLCYTELFAPSYQLCDNVIMGDSVLLT